MYVCVCMSVSGINLFKKNMLLCCVLLATAPNETAGTVRYVDYRKICCVTCKRKLNLDKRR